MLKDYRQVAASLYDGGWRAEDGDELQQEYNLTNEELANITNELEDMEHMDSLQLEEEEF